MDDIVKAALKKWPNVPAAYGWLGLDTRGDWYLRDEAVQAAGRFPRVKGSRIEHEKLREFIHRNYEVDERGCWFFQNGPQRVFVELEAAPFVWRVTAMADGEPRVQGHTGLGASVESSWLDQDGRLFLQTDRGLGLVHTLDMEAASHAVESGRWSPAELSFSELAQRFGYVLSPLESASR